MQNTFFSFIHMKERKKGTDFLPFQRLRVKKLSPIQFYSKKLKSCHQPFIPNSGRHPKYPVRELKLNSLNAIYSFCVFCIICGILCVRNSLERVMCQCVLYFVSVKSWMQLHFVLWSVSTQYVYYFSPVPFLTEGWNIFKTCENKEC